MYIFVNNKKIKGYFICNKLKIMAILTKEQKNIAKKLDSSSELIHWRDWK